MIPEPLQSALSPERWPQFVLITARLGGLMSMAPLWSLASVPRLARAALTLVLAVLLLPSAPAEPLAPQVLELPLAVGMEIAVGLVIGLAAAVLVHGAGYAGELVGVQSGLGVAPTLAPMPELQESGLGQLSSLLALALYVSIGGHVALLGALADSLRTLPPGGAWGIAGAGAAVEATSAVFRCALATGAPVVVTLLLAHAALGLLGRAVPQLNGMMVSFPVTIALGLLTLGAALPVMAAVLERWLAGAGGAAAALVAALAGGA